MYRIIQRRNNKMIKILKVDNSKFDYIDNTSSNKYLFLKHDAYRISVIKSDGKNHTIKLTSTILNLNTHQLLSTLIKIYNKKMINDFKKADVNDTENIFDVVQDVFSYIKEDEWTILMHRDTEVLLEKIFGSAYKENINNHINEFVLQVKNRRSDKGMEKIKESIYWTLYKMMNTRDDIGVQFVLHSKEFSPIAKLLIIDYIYETIFNDSKINDRILLYTSGKDDKRMDLIVRLLNSLGKFAIDYNLFSNVSSIIENCYYVFGLPLYLVSNILEEKYTKDNITNNIGFNYVDIVWERRYSVIRKIRDFINFHDAAGCNPYGESFIQGQGVGSIVSANIPSCPEPAINPTIGQSMVYYNPDNNLIKISNMDTNYSNMHVILFRDLMLKLDELRERWKSYKLSAITQNTKDEFIYDLKRLHNQILDARYRLRGNDTDTVDINSIEDNIFNLINEVYNHNPDRGIAESLGIAEENFISKAVKNGVEKTKEGIKNTVKKAAKGVKDEIDYTIESKVVKPGKYALGKTRVVTKDILRSIPYVADAVNSHDERKFKKIARKKAKKEYLEKRDEKRSSYESYFGYMKSIGESYDNLFTFVAIATSESFKGSTADITQNYILNEIKDCFTSEFIKYGRVLSSNDLLPYRESLEYAMPYITHPDNIKIANNLMEILTPVKKAPSKKKISYSEAFLPEFDTYDEYTKRQWTYNCISNMDKYISQVPKGEEVNFLNLMKNKFDGYLSSRHIQIIDNKIDDLKKTSSLRDRLDTARGEKYEINEGIYELYGPEERAFREPKDVVALCYRLMWNLKNTGKIDDFNQISKISLTSVDSKLYGLITTSKGEFLFDLSKVYSDIPTTLNGKKFDVSPEGHNINVVVNQDTNLIRGKINNPPTKEDDKPSDTNQVDEEEVSADVVEEKVIGNDNIDEEEKKEVLNEFEENILEKLEESGLEIKES